MRSSITDRWFIWGNLSVTGEIGGRYRGLKEDNVAEPLPHLIYKDIGSSHLLMMAGRAGLCLHSDSQMLAATVLI